MVTDTDWETPCPKREDSQHCDCWYDGEACHACGDAAELDDEPLRATTSSIGLPAK